MAVFADDVHIYIFSIVGCCNFGHYCYIRAAGFWFIFSDGFFPLFRSHQLSRLAYLSLGSELEIIPIKAIGFLEFYVKFSEIIEQRTYPFITDMTVYNFLLEARKPIF